MLAIVAGSVLVSAVTIALLYRAGFTQQRDRLIEIAHNQAHFIDTTARFHARRPQSTPLSVEAETLELIEDAHRHYNGFGETGGLAVGRREDDRIVFLTRHRPLDDDAPAPIPWEGLTAEPMRRALSGSAGWLVGHDFRGRLVLAAHEPVTLLRWGVVAKIDLAEVRAPYVRAAVISVGVAFVVMLLVSAGMVGFARPLITRVEASEASAQAIVDSALDAIITMDTQGVIRTFNTAAERIFGFSATDVVGGRVDVLIPQASRDTVQAYLDDPWRAGERRGAGVSREMTAQRKDGVIFPIDLTVSNIYIGGKRTLMGIVRDISARKAAEDTLRATESALRKIHHITSTAATPGDKIHALLAMGCEHFGVPTGVLARIQGERYTVMECVTPAGAFREGDEFALGATYCSETLRRGGPLHFDDVTTTELRGHPCYQETKLRAYAGIPVLAGGEVYGTLSFSGLEPRAQSFSAADDEILKLLAQWVGAELELREEHARLVQAEKLSSIGLFAAGVAHEINNPLSGVSACLKSLASGVLSPPKREEYYATAKDGLDRIQGIVKSLLDFARQRPTAKAPVDPAEIVNNCLRLVAPAVRKKHVHVEQRLLEGTIEMHADRAQLMQAVMNVLLNAIHAVPEGGTIEIASAADGQLAGIRIKDTGPGIPAHLLARVCDPFFTTKPEGEGTGLGLAVTMGLIEAHGGDLRIESEEGHGTTVTLWLPKEQVNHVAHSPR